ncbi:MAG: PQQ-binding-like beta-propeller repeat protein [Dehalococcoidia bacterium]
MITRRSLSPPAMMLALLIAAISLVACEDLMDGTPTESPPPGTTPSPGASPSPAVTPSPSPTQDGEDPVPPEVRESEDEWPLPNGDYANTRAASNSGLSSENVDDLGVAWEFPLPGSGPFGAGTSNPVILDGVAYFVDGASNFFAIDMENGELLWERHYDNAIYGPNGVAVGWGKVFGPKGILEVAALDIETGEEVWTARLDGPTGSFQPMVYNGMLFASDVAAGIPEGEDVSAGDMRFYEGGAAGKIYALDQESGDILWEFSTVEEGFWGNPEVNSGGGVWFAPAIDQETGLAYFGTGNPGPFPGTVEWPNGSSRPGDNLYTNSLIALDHEDGQMAWFRQVKPHDLYDHDNQNPPIFASVEIDGQERDIVIASGKHGRVVAYNRQSGELLWDTPVGRHMNDMLDELPMETPVPFFPGTLGGIEVPGAYADGVIYMPIVDLYSLGNATGFGGETSNEAYQNMIQSGPGFDEGTGQLVALDASTGIVLWHQDLPTINVGAATVVNDLVFTATYDGVIYAFNKDTGEQVWEAQAPAGINGWPAVAGDTIVWPAGVGGEASLVAYRIGAPGEVDRPGTPTPPAETPTGTPPVETPMGTPAEPTPDDRLPTETPTGTGTPPPSPTPAGTVTATPSPAPTPPAATPAPSPSPTGTPGNGDAVMLTITADNIAFDKDTLTAPAGAQVELELINEEGLPHNVSVYETSDMQNEIFVGELITGPNATITYEFTAPEEPGDYFFVCDVHPVRMTGTFVVE